MLDIDRMTFAQEVKGAGDQLSLARAALLFAKECAFPGLRPSAYLAELDSLAETARPTVQTLETTEAQGEALAQFLFQTLDFRGNVRDYADPRNSYLNTVLERRLGLPITLSVVFLEVATRLHLPVEGIGLPGHFIVSVMGQDGPVYLDPFHGGRRLTVSDCANLVQGLTGNDAFDPRWLNPTSTHDIVARMLNNLRNTYVEDEDWAKAATVIERLCELQPTLASHWRDLGLLQYRLGALRPAVECLNEYLYRAPKAEDAQTVRQGRDKIWDLWARQN